MRTISPILVLIGSALLAPAAHALDERGAMAVIEKFLAAQKFEDASASPGQHVIADLNGDGRQDIVLQWDEMGATWSRPRLSVFIDQGRNYRTLTTDLTGQIEKVSVSGPDIRIDTLMPGPKDARCCPSLKKQVRYRWANNKLGLAR